MSSGSAIGGSASPIVFGIEGEGLVEHLALVSDGHSIAVDIRRCDLNIPAKEF